jgi:alpha-galactosidase
MRKLLLVVLIALCSHAANAQRAVSAGLALTPPMGWNSWNWFARNVTQKDMEAAADALVSSGMKDAGYVYVNIDDTWEGTRDASGVLHTNVKFPDMKALGEYIHSRGLKFGIYSSPGPTTCAGYAASFGHEQQDADLYASWGVDYLKYDLCSFRNNMKADADAHPNDPQAANKLMIAAYVKMRKALDATGRPIVLSLCQYGMDDVWKWAPGIGGNLWRTTGDIKADYGRIAEIGFSQAGLAKYAGPGHWNDPDMLEVGNGKLTHDENVTHMSLWAILAAPLLAGNNLSTMSDDAKAILTNRGAIAIDQDKLGRQGDRLRAEGPEEVWTKPLAGGALAVGLFNRNNSDADMTVTLKELGIEHAASITDIWAGTTVYAEHGAMTFHIPRHGAVLLRIAK